MNLVPASDGPAPKAGGNNLERPRKGGMADAATERLNSAEI
jgi:hypothetical protein